MRPMALQTHWDGRYCGPFKSPLKELVRFLQELVRKTELSCMIGEILVAFFSRSPAGRRVRRTRNELGSLFSGWGLGVIWGQSLKSPCQINTWKSIAHRRIKSDFV